MRIPRWTRGMAVAAVAGLAAGACAATPDPLVEGFAPDQSYVVVDNRNTTISSATVYIYPTTGVRQRLGTVAMNEERAFPVDLSATSEYRLVADLGVDELASRTFTLTEGDIVEWNLDLNQIRYRDEAGG